MKSKKRILWEEGVILEMENQLECTTSDAQGVIEAHNEELEYCWNQNLNSTDTALYISEL